MQTYKRVFFHHLLRIAQDCSSVCGGGSYSLAFYFSSWASMPPDRKPHFRNYYRCHSNHHKWTAHTSSSTSCKRNALYIRGTALPPPPSYKAWGLFWFSNMFSHSPPLSQNCWHFHHNLHRGTHHTFGCTGYNNIGVGDPDSSLHLVVGDMRWCYFEVQLAPKTSRLVPRSRQEPEDGQQWKALLGWERKAGLWSLAQQWLLKAELELEVNCELPAKFL